MKYYDYSRGLKAPYSIQVLKNPKGKVLWVFSYPIGLSYFVFLFLGMGFLLLLSRIVTFPLVLGIDLNLICFFYLPHRFAKWYTETELDGKRGIVYVKDGLLFFIKYVLFGRELYRFSRVKNISEFSFSREGNTK